MKLLREGRIDFKYQDVVNASGVSKVTLYRRWPRRADLLREALKEHNSHLKLPSAGDWEGTVAVLMRRFAAFVADPSELAINVALISDPTSETSALTLAQWQPIQDEIVGLARAAQEKGDLPPDIDATALVYMLMAPIMLSTFLQRERIDDALLRQLIRIGKRIR